MKDKLLQIIFQPAAEEIESLQAKLTFWRTVSICFGIIIAILTFMQHD